jgi:hypothetical protein
MIVGLIQELAIVDVFDRGVPNRECIAIAVNETLDLGQYGVMLGVRGPTGSAFPIRDNLFWFGDGIVNREDWLFLYTGVGNPRSHQIPNTQHHSYALHWGRKTTILSNEQIVPLLFRVDAVTVQAPQAALASPI